MAVPKTREMNALIKVQNPRRTRVHESLKAHALDYYYVNGKYTEDFRQKTETEQNEAC